ncbi:MAG TPA: DUF4175 family protein [Myxococcota bacterium]|nr:DUF4175 family protein [Myxococcota bacterium]
MRRRVLAVALARLGVVLPFGLASVAAFVALVAHAGVLSPPLLRAVLLVLAGAAALALAGATVGQTLWRTRRDVELAHEVERRVRGLKDALRTALELERAMPALAARPVHSADLARAHARSTAERLEDVDVAAHWPMAPAPRARRGAVLALLAAAAFGLVAWRPIAAGVGVLFGVGAGLPVMASASVPLIGDLTLREVYPSYTGLAPRDIVASTGDLSALRGTVVELRATAVRPAAAAALVFADGPVVPLAVDGRTVTGSFTLDRTVDYRFALGAAPDALEAESILRRAVVTDDLYPEVEITRPAETLTLSERDVLEIDARASDDFGVTRVEVVFEPPGGEPLVRLVEALSEPSPTWDGSAKVPLAELGFAPGDEVRYRVEVTDDDLISGPKRGASAPLTLKIFSARRAHDEVLDATEQAVGQLVRILGDRLERLFPPPGYGGIAEAGAPAAAPVPSPGPASSAAVPSPALLAGAASPAAELDRAQEVVGDVLAATRSAVDTLDRLAAMLREDPLAGKDTARAVVNVSARLSDAMRTEVDRIREAALGIPVGARPSDKAARRVLAVMRKLNGTAVAELEGSIVYLDDLLHKERLADLLDAGEDVARARDALRDLLKKYADTKDPALKAAIARELDALKKKLAELGERMARLRSELPDEFMNEGAVAPVAGTMKSLEDMIDSGDIDGALAALEKMSADVDEMLGEMSGDATKWTESHFGGRAADLGRLAGAIEDLAAREDEIERRAAAIDDKRLGRTKDKLRDTLDRMAGAASDKLAEIRDALGEASTAPMSEDSAEAVARADGRLEALKGALASGDLPGARDEAVSLAGDLDGLSGALKRDAAAAPRSDAKAKGAVAAEPAAALKHASARTGKAAGTARALAESLEKVLPGPGEMLTPAERKELEALGGTQDELEKKAAAVEKEMRDKAGSMPVPAELGPDALGGARADMRGAADDLGAGESRHGKVKAESAADKLKRLAEGLKAEAAGSPSAGASSGSSEGGGVDSHEKVAIPGGEDHKGPKELREDILKAMKEESPERYRALVKRYYEELVK